MGVEEGTEAPHLGGCEFSEQRWGVPVTGEGTREIWGTAGQCVPSLTLRRSKAPAAVEWNKAAAPGMPGLSRCPGRVWSGARVACRPTSSLPFPETDLLPGLRWLFTTGLQGEHLEGQCTQDVDPGGRAGVTERLQGLTGPGPLSPY